MFVRISIESKVVDIEFDQSDYRIRQIIQGAVREALDALGDQQIRVDASLHGADNQGNTVEVPLVIFNLNENVVETRRLYIEQITGQMVIRPMAVMSLAKGFADVVIQQVFKQFQ